MYLLRIVGANKQVAETLLDKVVTLPVQPGATYTLLDPVTQKPVIEGVVLKKKGETLLIEVNKESVAQIEHFYTGEQKAIVDMNMAGGASGESVVTGGTPAAEGTDIVWEAADHGAAAGFELSGVAIGGAALGGVALAAGGGGGAAAVATAIINTVTGTIVGGPVIAGNDLTVTLYKADGVTVLGAGVVDANGQFSIAVGSYTGVVIARAVNGGVGADYLDEASGVGKDLNANLSSTGVVSVPNSTITLNINALTTVAHQTAVNNAAGGVLDANTVTQTNTAIASAFGVGDLNATTIVTTNGGAFNSADGLTAGETYGAVLAVLSGADLNNGGNTQTTIDNLIAGITVAGGTATIAPTAQSLLNGGASTLDSQTAGTGFATNTASSLALVNAATPGAPAAAATAVAGPVINAAEAAAGVAVTVSLAGAGAGVGDTIELLLGGVAFGTPQTHVLTLTDIQAGQITMTLPAGALGTDGSKSITSRITDVAGNVGTASPALVLTLDTTAPTVTITSEVSNNANTALAKSGDVITVSFTSTDPVTAATIGGMAATVTNTGGNNYTATYTVQAGDTGATGVSIAATDAVGNATTQTLASAVTMDTAAPTATATTATIDNTQNATVQSSETGMAYLVDSTITVNTLADITGSADVSWNSVAITTANSATNLAATGLANGTYKVYTTDAAGNLSAASTNAVTVGAPPNIKTSVVVFDLFAGVSSDHSNRTFNANTAYTIYIRVDSSSATLNTDGAGGVNGGGGTWGVWLGGSNLGIDDQIIFVGSGSPVRGWNGNNVSRFFAGTMGAGLGTSTVTTWSSGTFGAVTFRNWGGTCNKAVRYFGHQTQRVTIWTGVWLKSQNPDKGGVFATVYKTTMPVNILTSQGLV